MYPLSRSRRSSDFFAPVRRGSPLAPLLLFMLLFDTGEGALRFLLPLFVDELGQPVTVVGSMTALFGLVTLLSRIPTGVLYRPERARLVLVVSGAACSAAFFILPFTSRMSHVALLVALDALGWGIVTTVLLSIVLAAGRTGTTPAVAMGWFVGVNGLGHALAALIGGSLADVIGVREAFLVAGAAPLSATLLMGRYLPSELLERPPVADASSAQDEEPTVAAAAPERPERRGVRQEMARTLRLPAVVWTAAFVGFYANTMNSLIATFFPLLALALGMSLTQAGLLSAIRSGISALARFAAVPLLERFGERRLRTPAMTVTALATAAVPLTPALAVQIPLFASIGVSRGLLRVGSSTAAMESVVDHEDSGPVAGLLTMGMDLGKVLGPVLAGAIADVTGVATMFRILPLGLLAVFLILGRVRERPRPPERASSRSGD